MCFSTLNLFLSTLCSCQLLSRCSEKKKAFPLVFIISFSPLHMHVHFHFPSQPTTKPLYADLGTLMAHHWSLPAAMTTMIMCILRNHMGINVLMILKKWCEWKTVTTNPKKNNSLSERSLLPAFILLLWDRRWGLMTCAEF